MLPRVWQGLGLFAGALLLWVLLTPCGWLSPSLYLPPLLVGLLPTSSGAMDTWRGPWIAAVVYVLVLSLSTVVVVTVAGGPVASLLLMLSVILLLMLPLAALALAITDALKRFLRGRIGPAAKRNRK